MCVTPARERSLIRDQDARAPPGPGAEIPAEDFCIESVSWLHYVATQTASESFLFFQIHPAVFRFLVLARFFANNLCKKMFIGGEESVAFFFFFNQGYSHSFFIDE